MAEITPTVRVIEANPDKLKSLVWSWNGPRRHLTSSQKAMAYAMMYPDEEKGGRGNKLSRNQDSLSPNTKTEKNNIVYARFILKNNREKAELVRDGHPNCPLSKTYDAVKEDVDARKKDCHRLKRKGSGLNPDLLKSISRRTRIAAAPASKKPTGANTVGLMNNRRNIG